MQLRVIFQGGGARLPTLLAAAQAIEEIVGRDNPLQIAHIAGVSAGSIAGAALAAPQGISFFRENLLRESARFSKIYEDEWGKIESLFDKDTKALVKELSTKTKGGDGLDSIIDKFRRFNAWKKLGKHLAQKPESLAMLQNIWRGAPIFPEAEFERALQAVFSHKSDDPSKEPGQPILFSDLQHPFTAFYSELKDNSRQPFPPETPSPQQISSPVFKYLAMSSGIPFFLRSFQDGNTIYDGGLTGNLPISFFLDGTNTVTRTICFSFEPNFSQPAGLASTFRSVINCMMDSSLNEAVTMTEESGGVVCNLPNELTTFGFRQAAGSLEEHEFIAEKNKLLPIIEQKIEELWPFLDYPLIRQSKFQNEDAAGIVYNLIEAFPYRRRDSTRIYVDGAARPTSGITKEKLPHERYLVEDFQPLENDGFLVACQIRLPNREGTLKSMDVKVGKVLPDNKVEWQQSDFADIYVHRKERSDLDSFTLLFLFKKPIPMSECPVRILVRDEGGMVMDVAKPEGDFVTCIPKKNYPIDRMTFIGIEPPTSSSAFEYFDFFNQDDEELRRLNTNLTKPIESPDLCSGTEISRPEVESIVFSAANTSIKLDRVWGIQYKNVEYPSAAAAVIKQDNTT